MRLFKMTVALVVLTMVQGIAFADKEGFPGRTHEKYHMVPYIELEDLYKKLDQVVIVDARSNFEYDTLKIKDAINIPVALKTFDEEVKKLREKTDKSIVFYCNGHTCMKSYKATKRAMKLGLKDVYAYDAGIFEWAKAHPDQAVLLGKSPVDSREILSKKQYKARLLHPDKFSTMATDNPSDVIVLDIRDKYQRAGVGFFPIQERWTSLNKMDKVYSYIRKAKQKGKTLFIYDEVGKQVRWLQYALEREGIKNYYFMDKGATGYYDMITQFDSK
ncbi:MAG: rhodanese-like domain-containing protein [Gammaproteobacteria bacterium]|jgi:rhodanese-related sulfurtransferase